MNRKTLLAIAIPIAIGVGGWAGTSLISHDSRLSAVETEIRSQSQTNEDLKDWLKRIERKLDRALDDRSRRQAP